MKHRYKYEYKWKYIYKIHIPGSDFASGLAPGFAVSGDKKTTRTTKIAKLVSTILQPIPPSTGGAARL